MASGCAYRLRARKLLTGTLADWLPWVPCGMAWAANSLITSFWKTWSCQIGHADGDHCHQTDVRIVGHSKNLSWQQQTH
jgi:hypothetical protein